MDSIQLRLFWLTIPAMLLYMVGYPLFIFLVLRYNKKLIKEDQILRAHNLGDTESCVTPVFLSGGVGEATNLTVDLRENYGIFCSIVTYPVVPKGVIMLRLIPTAVHTDDDVETTINAFKEVKEKLFSGAYESDKIAQV